ncbi:MAG: 3-phosphoshikimate 1-carboxyvinyltransferase [Candidatus Omnitrophota bacterium]
MKKIINPINCLRGEIDLPGDKSISHRVVFIGSIASGKTIGKNFLKADDCLSTVEAFRSMGVAIDITDKRICVNGRGLRGLKKPDGDLYLGNSGTTMRILPGIIAGQDFGATLTGDKSLSGRPMRRIIDPLNRMGVSITSAGGGGTAPLLIKGGKVTNIDFETSVASAQVKSCILFAGLYADGITSITEPFISRDHTERMLKFCGAKLLRRDLTVSVEGGGMLASKEFYIPGDISSAAFFIAGGSILQGSDLVLRDVGLNPTRCGFINVLLRMGANIKVLAKKDSVEPYGDVRVRSGDLKSAVIEADEVPQLIDEIPILAVLASKALGSTVIKGLGELKVKETDRIVSITDNLQRMGVDIETRDNSIVVNGKKGRLKGGALRSFNDHRTAMSVAIAALYADGPCEIDDTSSISTSFPSFFNVLDYLKK